VLEKGNATMGVWLGKQLLGQVDHIDHRVEELPRVLRVICIPKIGEELSPEFPELRPPTATPAYPFGHRGLPAGRT